MSGIETKGKDYLLLAFERDGDDWSHASTGELLGPQSELKKVAKKKEGNALPQLQKMGSSRRQQIQDVAKELTAQESGDVAWEPVVIKTIKDYRNDDGKISVKAFNVLFARRGRKQPAPPKVKAAKPAPPPPAPKVEKPKEAPKEAKPNTYRRASTLNEVFGTDLLFSTKGEPMDSRGPIPYENAGLPRGSGAERPRGDIPPPPPPAAKPEPAARGQTPGLGNLDELFLEDLKPGEIDGIVEMPPDDILNRRRRRESRPAPRSRSRRRSSAVPEGGGRFRSNTRYSDHPSSRSSWASDDSAILEDWDDYSSRTSEETYFTSPRSSQRKTYRTIEPVKKYYYRSSRLHSDGGRLLVEKDRRPRYAIEDRHDSIGFEEPLPRRSSRSRPMVHQSQRPQSRHEIPPEVPDAPTYGREQSQQRYADNYMREKEREEAGQRRYSTRQYDFDPRQERRYHY